VEPSLKPAQPEVIVISSDDESEVKENQAVNGRKIRERSTKKNARAFSSVLSVETRLLLFFYSLILCFSHDFVKR
jgi:hypothetical protein